MAKRVTIMISDENDRQLRLLQAKRIQKEQVSVSYSNVVNVIIKKGFTKK